MSGARILVTDGGERSALAVVRSLGAAGHHVVVGAAEERSLAGCSRYAATSAVLPDPVRAPEAFASALEATVRAERIDLVLPIAEGAMLVALGTREALRPALVPFPPLETFRRICDKAQVLSTAASLGIAVPEQTVAESFEASVGAAARAAYPLVLKPSRSIGEHGGERRKLGVSYAADAAEAAVRLRAMPPQAFPVLLQRRVVGPGIGIFLLRWEGRIVASFAHRRIREKPPSGGVSVYREATSAPAELLARSIALLEAFDWTGPAMVEYKLDEASGRAYLMEINGRFWGSVQLAIDAGVDFPALLVACARGESPAPVTSWRIGGGLRWELGEVDHVLARLRRGGLADGLRAAAEVLRPVPGGTRREVWRADDPAPFRHELARWVRGR